MLRRNSNLFLVARPSSILLSGVSASVYTSRLAAETSKKSAGLKLDVTFAEQIAKTNLEREQKGEPHPAKGSFKDDRPLQASSTGAPLTVDTLRRRLMFQARYRGMAELDLILGSFSETRLPLITTMEELIEFDAILRELDTDLFHWLITMPGRKAMDENAAAAAAAAAGAGGDASTTHAAQTRRSILSGTSDYSVADLSSAERKSGNVRVEGSTPDEGDFIEPPELLNAEWHRRDEVPEALRKNSVWKQLCKFVESERETIVKYR